MPPGEVLIELKGVTVRNGPQVLVDHVDLQVRQGEIVGIVFAKGVGRSTILRVAAGFFKPDEGQVLFNGRNVAEMTFDEEREFQTRTGFIFQNGGLLVNTKVYDNVALSLRYDPKLTDADIDQKVKAALTTVGMLEAADKFPWELSIARQKLCALARALVREPTLIFYDGFATGTEPDVWHLITRLVRQLRASRGIAWVLVMEPDPGIYPIADRLAVIEHGKILEIARPNQLKESKDVRVTGMFKTVEFDAEEI